MDLSGIVEDVEHQEFDFEQDLSALELTSSDQIELDKIRQLEQAYGLLHSVKEVASQQPDAAYQDLERGAEMLEASTAELSPIDRFNAYETITTACQHYADVVDTQLQLLERIGQEELPIFRRVADLMMKAGNLEEMYDQKTLALVIEHDLFSN